MANGAQIENKGDMGWDRAYTKTKNLEKCVHICAVFKMEGTVIYGLMMDYGRPFRKL